MSTPLTYAEFLLAFLVPAVIVLALAVRLRDPTGRGDVYPAAIGLIVVLALAYTIPWDNYLVARGVWWYGEGTVSGRLWHAPFEEYAFIVLQSLVTALWVGTLATVAPRERSSVETLAIGWRPRTIGVLAALAVGVVGVGLLAAAQTLYLGAILAWAAPVLAIQWAFGWPQLWRRRRTILLAIVVPTAYLCVADWIAISLGIWQFSPTYTTGSTLGGLPIEEALFFLVTNAFVVQGLVLYAWLIERRRNRL